ncbi:MAG: GtrA family protein [Saprospiraceae bacterium]|nr:GtrA family protein [Saprospiraceae bacterium]
MKTRDNITNKQKIVAGEQPLPRPLRRQAQLLGKYGSTSLAATTADFAMFHAALTLLGALPVQATVMGRSVGSVVAFLLHRSWVFKNAKNRDDNALRIKYVVGIFIGMGLNAAGVWLLNGGLGVEPWPARVVTATAVWLFGFLFNKKIVFG